MERQAEQTTARQTAFDGLQAGGASEAVFAPLRRQLKKIDVSLAEQKRTAREVADFRRRTIDVPMPAEEAGETMRSALQPSPPLRHEAPVACRDGIDNSRNRIERLWAGLKERRAVATRHEKNAVRFLGVLCLAAVPDWLKNQQALSG